MAEVRNKKLELIADVREQLLYLQELGVSDFSVELPALTAKVSPRKQKQEDLRMAPADLEGLMSTFKSKTIEPKVEQSAPAPRRNLLSSTKISDLANKKPEPAPNHVASPTETMTSRKSETKTAVPVETAARKENETVLDIHAEIGPDCKRCDLCEGRTQVVNSVGDHSARLMIVGEAPGADEDLKGEPFVGRAGKLLTKILEAIEIKREDVFIGNINRCRPPDNRQPTLEESAMCKPFLLREIEAVKPAVIVVLGNTATKNLLDTKIGITKLRGEFAEYFGTKVMPTFHPAYLLRDPRKKREVWEDMKKVRAYLDSMD